MDDLDAWFPYESYRPHQRGMLDLVARTAAEGGIAMIDAPTGSGKSSAVAALLARARGRKVVVAVRTVSQLNTFVRELELIRKKRGRLKFAYLVGKGNMCPMAGAGDTYRLCEGLKTFSTSLMRERAQRGALVPVKDPFIRQQMRRVSMDHPVICPYFIHTRSYAETSEGLKMLPSAKLRTLGERACSRPVAPETLHEFCGDLCPYEVMLQAAREADVVLVNFHHLFDKQIREQIFDSLDIEAERTLLLIDEAHNCGDTIQSIQSVSLGERNLEAAYHEIGAMRSRQSSADAVLRILPRITAFMESLRRSWKEEDWFDPAIFSRHVLGGSLYATFDQIIEDLLSLSEAIRERNIQAGEFRESAAERLCDFFYHILRATESNAFLSVYKKVDEEVFLEVRNIDPADTLQEIAAAHPCTVLISGTLSPVESYRRYYFGDTEVATLSLPNAFPREHRRLFCTRDITSAYRQRRDPENTARIGEYIRTFAGVGGNLAVYFPSYDLLNTHTASFGATLAGKEVFIEASNSSEAAAALKRFLSLPAQGRAGILFGVCGGKWSEGLDYRGELLTGAMVIGLPLAPFNPVRKMVIEYYRSKFGEEGEFISYTLPAINRGLQALGRVLRTPEDTGLLVLGDSRFLDRRVHAGLPPWMQEELAACDTASFAEAVRAWR
ncbi:MAG: ATP-dependent DNA helicase [Methanomicrobiaceae archaeon]|nr:ATP-dependent DNA helicase [Methanomicrobiaceae archaeon]